MLVGKPVRRIESVVDLRLRVLPAAARHLLEDEIVLRLGLRCDRISPIRRLGGKCGSREQSKRQSGSDVFHGYPQRDWPTRLSGESRNWKEMAQQPVELLRTGKRRWLGACCGVFAAIGEIYATRARRTGG